MHTRRLKEKKLGRKKAPRRAMMRSLVTSIILYEKVNTTKAKAREARRVVEKLITLAKKETQASKRKLMGYLMDDNAARKLSQELVPIYKNRKGGYTRVLNLGHRVGDSAPMARIELLDTDKILKIEKSKNEKTKEQKSKKDKTDKKQKEDKAKSGKNKDKENKKKTSREKDKVKKTKTKTNKK